MNHINEILIRQAESKDASDIEQLYKILCPDQSILVDPEHINSLLINPKSYLLVAELNKKIIGTVLLLITIDTLFGKRPVGTVRNLIVDPTIRRMGVGRKLMNEVIQVSREAGVTGISLNSALKRKEAHALFRSIGFIETLGFVYYSV